MPQIINAFGIPHTSARQCPVLTCSHPLLRWHMPHLLYLCKLRLLRKTENENEQVKIANMS